jgi:hypothetical protein
MFTEGGPLDTTIKHPQTPRDIEQYKGRPGIPWGKGAGLTVLFFRTALMAVGTEQLNLLARKLKYHSRPALVS